MSGRRRDERRKYFGSARYIIIKRAIIIKRRRGSLCTKINGRHGQMRQSSSSSSSQFRRVRFRRNTALVGTNKFLPPNEEVVSRFMNLLTWFVCQ